MGRSLWGMMVFEQEEGCCLLMPRNRAPANTDARLGR
jgi:hypothetical protein